jgi:hypothetical protein
MLVSRANAGVFRRAEAVARANRAVGRETHSIMYRYQPAFISETMTISVPLPTFC